MGKYGDWSKSQSKYLNVDYGQKVTVKWTGKAILSRGKYGEGWDFDFITDTGIKTLSFRNTRIVSQFDNYKEGDELIIYRNLQGEKPAWSVSRVGDENIPF